MKFAICDLRFVIAALAIGLGTTLSAQLNFPELTYDATESTLIIYDPPYARVFTRQQRTK